MLTMVLKLFLRKDSEVGNYRGTERLQLMEENCCRGNRIVNHLHISVSFINTQTHPFLLLFQTYLQVPNKGNNLVNPKNISFSLPLNI